MDKLSGVVSARRDSRGSNKVTLRDIHTMPHSNTRSSCRCCYSAAAAAAAHTRPGAAVGGLVVLWTLLVVLRVVVVAHVGGVDGNGAVFVTVEC